jgi:hypothetical protein
MSQTYAHIRLQNAAPHNTTTHTKPTANTGSGSGGSGGADNFATGSGGSGIVIVRYLTGN